MRIAILQFAPVLGRLEPNLETIRAAAAEAASHASDLLIAPEMSLSGWTLPDPALRVRLAGEVEKIAVPELTRTAAANALAIIVGGPVAVAAPSGGPRPAPAANAVIMLAPDGRRTDYWKIHLFGVERDWWTAGDHPVVGMVGRTRVGLTICYDAEFPEVPRLTRLAGAEIIAVPTTNMAPYEHDQAVIFATRAIENECPVVVANRVGHENGWSYFGRSVAFDQRGQVVAQAGRGEEILYAHVDPADVADPALSYLARRRPEIYGPLAASDGRTTHEAARS
jgi:predicted amidohydrolase